MFNSLVVSKGQNQETKFSSSKRLMSTTALLAVALLATSPVNAQTIPDNSWDYDTVLGGNVGKDTSVIGITDITVTGGNGFVEGNADIYAGQTVNVDGDSGATFAYRDNRANITSTLNGNLNSNMKIIVIDKDGVFFGVNSRINVQSLITTSADIQVADIMDGGDLTFDNVGDGGSITIESGARITVAEAGLAAFVSPFITNNGIIRAKMGNVVMAAGETVTLDLYGDGLIEVAVSGQLADALIENKGQILAEGGNVQITASAAKNTIDNIVNNEGVINVSSVSVQGGKIILSGGANGVVRNAGVLDARGGDGGSVEITGEHYAQGPAVSGSILGQPKILTGGGDVDVTISGDVVIAEGFIDADGGNINIDNDGVFSSAGSSSLRTNTVGTIDVNQNDGGSIQNVINALSNIGTGTNTINVGAGTYNEAVRINEENVTLNGANAGVHGRDPSRDPLESVIVPNSPGIYITADNAVVDGFEIVGGESGVRINGADNAVIKNNIIRDQYHVSGDGDSIGAWAAGDGVFVQNATNTTIDSNYIYGMNDDGIQAVDVVDLSITKNVIYDADEGDQGITIARASGTTIVDGNTVIRARRDGIQLIDVDGDTSVSNNIMFHAGRSGINLVNLSGDTVVDDNTIAYTGMGIDIVNSENVLIGDTDGKNGSGNIIHHVDLGIKSSSNNNITIEDNVISDAYEGILVQNTNYLYALSNSIETSGNGIRFQGGINAQRAFVYNNDIAAGNVGILVENGVSNGSIVNLGAYANGNTIIAGVDGIRVEGVIEGSRVRVTGSDITGGEDGIEFEFVGEDAVAAVWYNKNIVGENGDGVKVGGVTASVAGSGFSVVGNINIEGSNDGIEIGDIDVASVAIVDNDLITGLNNGINFSGNITNSSSSILIGDDGIDGTDSAISGFGGNGINFEGEINNSSIIIGEGSVEIGSVQATTSYVIEAGNGVTVSGGQDGININGEIINSSINISDSKITGGDDGIDITDAGTTGGANVSIIDNYIYDAGDNGIEIDNVYNADILGNEISNNYDNGLYVAGLNNGLITFQGNTLTDNGKSTGSAAARFESGDIDISDLGNPNTFINTTALPATAMQFDDIGTTSNLRIVNETLGSTVFYGYLPTNSFYVRFEDGSILDGSNNPIVIDGTDASFDGVIPGSFAGEILPTPTLNFIEERLYDADDATVNGRGQIFVGSTLAPTLNNLQDFLPRVDPNDAGSSRSASVLINGLPPIGGFGSLGGLNDLAPAAGGEGEADELANINPAAGEGNNGGGQATTQKVTCLGDVLGSLSSGSVAYSFGGSFEDSIASASACSTSAI